MQRSKGVILSTGDYSQNTKMLKHFCPEVIENNIQCLFTNVDVEGNFTNQGDGIQLVCGPALRCSRATPR